MAPIDLDLNPQSRRSGLGDILARQDGELRATRVGADRVTERPHVPEPAIALIEHYGELLARHSFEVLCRGLGDRKREMASMGHGIDVGAVFSFRRGQILSRAIARRSLVRRLAGLQVIATEASIELRQRDQLFLV